MTQRHRSVFVIAALAACTSVGSSEPPPSGGDSVPTDRTSPTVPDADPESTPPASTLEVAVGSVLLRNDCPDREAKLDALVPAATAPAAAAPPEASMPKPSPARKRKPGTTARRACEQSTLQITFVNRGTQARDVQLQEVRLRDAATGTVVGTLDSRVPSRWSEAEGAYTGWDEALAPGASIKSSYKIKPPAWHTVDDKLGGIDSHGHAFDVQVVVASAGETVEAASATFVRPPRVIMPPT